MDIKVTPSRLSGTVDAVSSKSFAHRLLICAALSDRKTRIHLNGLSEDILATVRCLEAMGCSIETEDDALLVTPLSFFQNSVSFGKSFGKNGLAICSGLTDFSYKSKEAFPKTEVLEKPEPSVVLHCGESGSTARFLLPLIAHLFDNFTLTGSGKLPSRPFAPLCNALANAGCTFDSDKLPITGTGRIQAGDFSIEGGISSQFISGLLFVLPLLDGDSRINITTPLQSAAYVNMTIEVLALFGIGTEKCESGFLIEGKRRYQSPGTVTAEGDWSNAAFFLCMGALSPVGWPGGTVSLRGLSPHSTQGDREVTEILRRFGADIDNSTVTAAALHGISIDAAQIPDLVPTLAVVASVASGETRIFNAQRLRLKESDRIQSTFDLLCGLGADAKITEDGLIIHGKERLRGGIVDGAGDHRIVMAAAAAACVCEAPVVIRGCEAVNKSYPSFFEDFRAIGGVADVIQPGK